MTIIEKLAKLVDEKVKKSYSKPYLALSNQQMKDIFGENFSNDSVIINKSDYSTLKTHYFYDNTKFYSISFYEVLDYVTIEPQYDSSKQKYTFFQHVNDEQIQTIYAEYRALIERAKQLEKVVSHPNMRMKLLFWEKN